MSMARNGPKRDDVANRTISRLAKFTSALESGKQISEVYSLRKIVLNIELEPLSANEIKALRKMLRVSQAVFARFLNVSVSAVQKWERGQKPDGAACRLLDDMFHHQDYWAERFKSMIRVVDKPKATSTSK